MRNPSWSVIVPAVLGAGIAFSLLSLARDGFRRLRGQRWLNRRSELDGRATALLTIGGEEAARRDHAGLRPRTSYATLSIGFILLSMYLTLGSYGNYVGWTGWVESVAWVEVLYLIAIGGFATVGVVAGAVALRYDRPPTWTRRLLVRTPLTLAQLPRGPKAPVRKLSPHTPEATPRRRPLGPHQIDERIAILARMVAAVWGIVAIVTFAVAAARGMLPNAPDPDTMEPAVAYGVQIGLVLVMTFGTIVAHRAEAVGAIIMAMAALGLALLAAMEYPPWLTPVIAVAFGMPAFLHWLAWQRHRHVHHLGILALVTLLLLGVVTAGADALSDRMTGPAHPPSAITTLPPSAVEWAWAGGTTTTGTTVVARLAAPQSEVRLVISEHDDLREARRSEPQAATEDGHRIVRFAIDGLEPDRRYAYAFEVDGVLDQGRSGHVRTFPEGSASFTVAFGSCARTGSNGAVYDAIRSDEPLLYLATGDLFYGNIEQDDLDRFLRAYDLTLGAPAQSLLYRSTSTAYIWDDHDYGGNDADRTSPSRAAALAGYRAAVPHYPLTGGPSDPVQQSFPIGRLQVVITDARSNRDPTTESEPATRTMLGEGQIAWFEQELHRAADAGRAVVWVNATPWIGAPDPTADTWAGYAAERERLARIVHDAGLDGRLVMLSGDAHMVAIDDGTNTDVLPGDGGGFPLGHGAALDRPGGVKGGPYSEGTFPGAGQYGLLEVEDDGGDEIRLSLVGHTWDERELVRHEFTLGVGRR